MRPNRGKERQLESRVWTDGTDNPYQLQVRLIEDYQRDRPFLRVVHVVGVVIMAPQFLRLFVIFWKFCQSQADLCQSLETLAVSDNFKSVFMPPNQKFSIDPPFV